jgi:hypothetical protein
VILAEIGTNMSHWPTVKHFCSWLGLIPGSKVMSGLLGIWASPAPLAGHPSSFMQWLERPR